MSGKLLRHSLTLLITLLFATLSARAQQGSGDLPPPTKSKPKTTTPARTRPTATPTPRIPTFREPTSIAEINFNQSIDGGIDGQASGRIPPGTYFNEYLIKLSAIDLFTIQLQSANPSLTVQLTENNRIDIPIIRDQRTGVYKIKNEDGTVAADGTYRVRVMVNASGPPPQPILYKLAVNRTGLTEAGYEARLQQIVSDYRSQKDAVSALVKLEELTKDDPNRAGAFEYLGVLHLEYGKDLVKATTNMTQALKLGGAALFRVNHDSQWRRPARQGRGANLRFNWPDQRTSWLKVYKDKLVIAELGEEQKELLTLTGAQVQNFGRVPPSPVVFIKHNNSQFKPDNISFGVPNPLEADLIVDLINDFVAAKKLRAPRLLNQ